MVSDTGWRSLSGVLARAGVLIERIQQQVARLRQCYPHIAFALGGHFGFDEGIYAIADARVSEHATTGGMLECDGCKYRLAAAHDHQHDHHHNHAHDRVRSD